MLDDLTYLAATHRGPAPIASGPIKQFRAIRKKVKASGVALVVLELLLSLLRLLRLHLPVALVNLLLVSLAVRTTKLICPIVVMTRSKSL